MRRKPRFLVCQIAVENPKGSWDSRTADDRTQTSWFTLCTEAEVAELANYDKAGFGTDYETVTYEVHRIEVTEQLEDVTVTPRTVRDEALRMATAGRVDVGLRGHGWDPKGVFWDTRGNSFAVIVPPADVADGPHRDIYVSEQGVMLVSINGMGEVRWSVRAREAGYAENAEAVAHFGLTWKP